MSRANLASSTSATGTGHGTSIRPASTRSARASSPRLATASPIGSGAPASCVLTRGLEGSSRQLHGRPGVVGCGRACRRLRRPGSAADPTAADRSPRSSASPRRDGRREIRWRRRYSRRPRRARPAPAERAASPSSAARAASSFDSSLSVSMAPAKRPRQAPERASSRSLGHRFPASSCRSRSTARRPSPGTSAKCVASNAKLSSTRSDTVLSRLSDSCQGKFGPQASAPPMPATTSSAPTIILLNDIELPPRLRCSVPSR